MKKGEGGKKARMSPMCHGRLHVVVLALIPLVICSAIMAKVGLQSNAGDEDGPIHRMSMRPTTWSVAVHSNPSDTLQGHSVTSRTEALIQAQPNSQLIEILTKPSQTSSSGLTLVDSAAPSLRPPTENEVREELLRLGLPLCAWNIYNEEYSKRQLTHSSGTTLPHSIPQAGIDHVYMIHYSPLKKRRALMTNLLAAHGVSAEWFLGFDKDQLNASMVDCLHRNWIPDKSPRPNRTYARKAKAKRHIEIPARPQLKPSQQSVVIKHHAALYDMVRHGYRTALILEDDAFLRVNFVERLSEVMRAVTTENEKSSNKTSDTELSWLDRFGGCDGVGAGGGDAAIDCPRPSEKPPLDIIMIGGCMRMFGWRRKFRTVQLSKHLFEKQEARCAHAFVVTLQGAKALLASIPLTLPIDFQITRAMVEWNLRAVWVEPYLSVQGDTGECVTNDLGAGCVSVEKGIDLRPFDVRFLKDSKVNAMWDVVPEHNSRK